MGCNKDCVSFCNHQVECNSKMDPTTTSFLKVIFIPVSSVSASSVCLCFFSPLLTSSVLLQMADAGGLPQLTQVKTP